LNLQGYPLAILQGEINQKYVCGICHLVLRNPVQRYCGHTYCEICVDRTKSSNTNDIECLACLAEGVEEVVDDELPSSQQVHMI
jgi:RING-type zinc-finger